MTLWFANDEVGDFLAYGDDQVAILWYGDDEVYRLDEGPQPTIITLEYLDTGANLLRLKVGGQGIVTTIRENKYNFFSWHITASYIEVAFLGGQFFIPADTTPAQQVANLLAEPDITFRMVSTDGVDVTFSSADGVTGTGGGRVRWNGVTFKDSPTNTEYTLTITVPPTPPAGPLLAQTLNSVTISPDRAWGVFSGLNWTFSHGGTDYTITAWFTDQNGLHIRFQNQTQALAFIAAGLTVDSGITGAPEIDSSNMVNLPAVDARTGPTFTQRYADATSYNVTISE